MRGNGASSLKAICARAEKKIKLDENKMAD